MRLVNEFENQSVKSDACLVYMPAWLVLYRLIRPARLLKRQDLGIPMGLAGPNDS